MKIYVQIEGPALCGRAFVMLTPRLRRCGDRTVGNDRRLVRGEAAPASVLADCFLVHRLVNAVQLVAQLDRARAGHGGMVALIGTRAFRDWWSTETFRTADAAATWRREPALTGS